MGISVPHRGLEIVWFVIGDGHWFDLPICGEFVIVLNSPIYDSVCCQNDAGEKGLCVGGWVEKCSNMNTPP